MQAILGYLWHLWWFSAWKIVERIISEGNVTIHSQIPNTKETLLTTE